MHFKNSKWCWCWKILKFKYIMQKAICQNHVFSCFMIFLKEKKASVKMHFSYHFCKIFVNKKIVNKCDDCCCEFFYLNADDDREKMHFCLRYFVTTYKHAIWCTFCVFYLKTAGGRLATRIAMRFGKGLDSPNFPSAWTELLCGCLMD